MRMMHGLWLLLAISIPTASQADTGPFSTGALKSEELARIVAAPGAANRADEATAIPGAASAEEAIATRVGTGSFYGQLLNQHSIRPVVDQTVWNSDGFFNLLLMDSLHSD